MGDGVVDIVDLVKVAAVLGIRRMHLLSIHRHLRCLLLLMFIVGFRRHNHRNLTEAASQRGIRFLEQLLTVLTPEETVLLPNYPNPFNQRRGYRINWRIRATCKSFFMIRAALRFDV